MYFSNAIITLCSSVILFALAACSVTNKAAQKESAVGTITYSQYTLRTTPASTDTAYHVVTNQPAFDALFVSAEGSVDRRPEFSAQTVVAVSLPATAEARVEKAAIIGRAMNVYLGNCSAEKTDCSRNGLLLATTPKSSNVKEVRFYVNGSLRRSMNVE